MAVGLLLASLLCLAGGARASADNRQDKVRLMAHRKAFRRFSLSTALLLSVSPMIMSGFFLIRPVKVYATTDTFSSSGTWSAPAGVTSVTITAWGGGGGGMSGTAASGKGAGGGGAYSSGTVTVTPSNNYTVTVGTGGSPGSGGGDSWFSTTGTVLAKGGATGTATTGGAGGALASGVGTVKHSGGAGGNQSGNGKGGGGGGGSATASADGGGGTASNNGGSGGSGQGAGGGGGGNGGTGSTGNPPGGGGGGGGAGAASGGGAAGEIDITYTPPVISVAISTGSVTYGTLAASSSKDTTSADLNNTQVATNDGNVAEDFNIKGQSSTGWTLSGSAGSEQYAHFYCTSGSGSPDPCDASPTWTALTTSYQSMASSIAVSGNKRFDLKINTPTVTSATSQQSVDVTVQAVAH